VTIPDGYYDTSYPPSLWAPPEPPVAAARTVDRSAAEQSTAQLEGGTVGTSPLTVSAGTPGTYTPAVSAAERPRNVTELAQRARPADPAPWTDGQYVLVGTTGKRAHWTGELWRGGEASAPPLEGPPDVQFPGVDDSPQDLHR